MDFTNLKIFGELDLCASLFIYASIAFTLCCSFFIVSLYKERKKLKATVEAFKRAEKTFAAKDSYDFYVQPKDFRKLLIEVHYLQERLAEMKEKISALELGIILSETNATPSSPRSTALPSTLRSTDTKDYEYEDIFIDSCSSGKRVNKEGIQLPYKRKNSKEGIQLLYKRKNSKEGIKRPYRPSWERERADWLLFEKAIGTEQRLSALKDEDE